MVALNEVTVTTEFAVELYKEGNVEKLFIIWSESEVILPWAELAEVLFVNWLFVPTNWLVLLSNGKVFDNDDDWGDRGGAVVEVENEGGEGGDVVKLVNGGREDIGGSILFDGAGEGEIASGLEDGFEAKGICAYDISIPIESINAVNRNSERIKESLIKN